MEMEIYLRRKDSLCGVLNKEIFEVECNDMVVGDIYLEDDMVRFVRFDGEIFKRTIEEGDIGYDYQDSEDVAEELVTENLTEFFNEIKSKIEVKDTMDSTDAKRYDLSKQISVGFLDFSLKKT